MKKKLIKLNLGCGSDIIKGFLNTDILIYDERVKYVNLEKDLLFEDNTFEYIKAHLVLEHIHRKIEELLFEIWRVSKPNAIIDIKVPHFSSGSTYCAAHPKFFRCDEFDAYDGSIRLNDNKHHNPHMPVNKHKFNFKVMKTDLIFNKGLNPLDYPGRIFNLNKKMRLIFDSTFIHNIFLASEIRFKLKAIK